jgi:thymidylate kinase
VNLEIILNSQPTVIFEGITGCGKTTQLNRFVDNKNVVVIGNDSPVYGLSKDFRKYLLDSGNPLLANMLIHQSTNWLKLVNNPKSQLLLIDRFLLSNLVYTLIEAEQQSIPINRSKTREQILRPLGLNPLENTLTIYFDINPKSAYQRTLNRKQKNIQGDIRNKFDIQLQTKASKVYEEELCLFKYPVRTIDGTDYPEEIHNNVIKMIKEYGQNWLKK